jgi:hypothetical protein
LDYGKITVQPAGPAGKRHVFLTLSFHSGDTTIREVEFVFSKRAAQWVGEALLSGSVGVMREFNLAGGSE